MGNRRQILTGKISETDHVAVLMARAEATARAAGLGRTPMTGLSGRRIDRSSQRLLYLPHHPRRGGGFAAGWWLIPTSAAALLAWLTILQSILG